MTFFNKKGSALMQVMVLGSIIAAIIVMLMRFSVGRTANMLKTKREVQAKAFMEGCLAQYNTMAMERALKGYPILLDGNNKELFTCKAVINGNEYTKDILITWGSTVTGLGIVSFQVSTPDLE